MDDIHRYFREETNKKLDQIEKKIDQIIESEIAPLKKLNWMIHGAAWIISAILSLAITIIFRR